jgi:hypothetical protein
MAGQVPVPLDPLLVLEAPVRPHPANVQARPPVEERLDDLRGVSPAKVILQPAGHGPVGGMTEVVLHM